LNQLTDLRETWYERYTNGDHSKDFLIPYLTNKQGECGNLEVVAIVPEFYFSEITCDHKPL
jgi:hypothetical protein